MDIFQPYHRNLQSKNRELDYSFFWKEMFIQTVDYIQKVECDH